MKAYRVDEVRAILPELDVLKPFFAGLADTARPDQERQWTASGEMEAVGQRLVDLGALDRAMPGLVESARARVEELYRLAADSVRGLVRGDPGGAVRALVRAAEIEQGDGRLDEAEALAVSAIELADGSDLQAESLLALMAGARIARSRGDWRVAAGRYHRVRERAVAAGDQAIAARAAVGLGNLAIDRGAWSAAVRHYDEAEAAVRRVGADLPEAWHLAVNRSIVAREEGRFDDAAAEIERARSLIDGTGPEVAVVDNAEGQVLMAGGRIGEAELVFRRALAAAGDTDASVTIGANLAEALLLQGRTLEAGQELRRAEHLALLGSRVPRLPEIYTLLGRVAAARGHPDAFVLFESALSIVQDESLPEVERARVLEWYGRHEVATGDRAAGRERLAEAARIHRSLGSQAAAVRLEAMVRETEGRP